MRFIAVGGHLRVYPSGVLATTLREVKFEWPIRLPRVAFGAGDSYT